MEFQKSSPAPQFKGIDSLAFCLLYCPALTPICDPLEDHSLAYIDFVSRVMSLLSTHCIVVIAFLLRNNHLPISWLQSPSSVILEPKKKKSVTTYTFSLSICHEVVGPDTMILGFFNIYF